MIRTAAPPAAPPTTAGMLVLCRGVSSGQLVDEAAGRIKGTVAVEAVVAEDEGWEFVVDCAEAVDVTTDVDACETVGVDNLNAAN